MKRLSYAMIAMIAMAAIGMMALAAPVQAQQAKPSAAALASAREILAAKNISAIYRDAVPGMVQRTKDVLLQNNLNYQKDLNEVAVKVAKDLNGRESEIGNQVAVIYATIFTEQELKDLAVFYKSPLGKKVIDEEPAAFNQSRAFMQQWADKFSEEINGKFRAEMRARGKEI